MRRKRKSIQHELDALRLYLFLPFLFQLSEIRFQPIERLLPGLDLSVQNGDFQMQQDGGKGGAGGESVPDQIISRQ